MAIQLGVTTSNRTTGAHTTNTISLAGTTAGRALAIVGAWSSVSATISSIVCTGETCSVRGSPAANASLGGSAQGGSIAALVSGGTKSIDINFSASISGSVFSVFELYDDAGGTVVFDVANGGTGNTSNGSVSLTTTGDGAAVVSHCSINFLIGEPTQGTGYTLFDTLNLGGFDAAEYDLDVGAAGSKTVPWVNGADEWAIAALAFKVQVAGGGSSPIGAACL